MTLKQYVRMVAPFDKAVELLGAASGRVEGRGAADLARRTSVRSEKRELWLKQHWENHWLVIPEVCPVVRSCSTRMAVL